MSSGGVPDFSTAGRRSTVAPSNMNIQKQGGSFSSPISGNPADPTAQILSRQGPDSMPMGKRSLAEFQQQQNFLKQQQGLEFYLRNMKKPRHGYQNASPIPNQSAVNCQMEVSSVSSSLMNNVNPRGYGLPILKQQSPQSLILSNTSNVSTGTFLPNLVSNKASEDSIPGRDFSAQESKEKMLNDKLQELEKRLLGDEDEAEEVSTVTTTEWSETMLNLINPARKHISPSPTSSSSSCSSTAASPLLPCPKQYLINAAVAISEGKPEIACEVFSRLQHLTNERRTSEQRLAVYMVSALKSRALPIEHPPPPVSELYGNKHYAATQLLYDVLPCFKLGFMAANLAILAAASERGLNKIHIVDFDIGHGVQYLHLIHALAAATMNEGKPSAMLKITTFTDSAAAEKLKYVGDRLKSVANRKGVGFSIRIKNSDLSRENLEVQSDEALAVNFAFKLYKIPDESVSTENQRDDLLRRVKTLSPAVMTVVEQEMNTNTAPLVARVREVWDHYGALLESLDVSVSTENPNRVRIEEGVCRRMKNSVACEGRDRVERCEVFGKWRARFGMCGFKIRPMSQPVVDSLRYNWTRGNPGFTINEESGGVSLGWMGRTITVASAWY